MTKEMEKVPAETTFIMPETRRPFILGGHFGQGFNNVILADTTGAMTVHRYKRYFWFFNGKIFLLKREMSSKPSKCLLTRDIYSYLEVKYNLVFIWQNKSPSATTLVCSLIFSKEKEINGFQSKCSLGFLIVFELFPIKK